MKIFIINSTNKTMLRMDERTDRAVERAIEKRVKVEV